MLNTGSITLSPEEEIIKELNEKCTGKITYEMECGKSITSCAYTTFSRNGLPGPIIIGGSGTGLAAIKSAKFTLGQKEIVLSQRPIDLGFMNIYPGVEQLRFHETLEIPHPEDSETFDLNKL